jgi:DNA primase
MNRPNIGKILEHYGAKRVSYEFRGWRKINCPFHDDSVASGTYSIEANAFNCFGCGVKGDSYKIIMEKEGITFNEANTFAEENFGGGGQDLQPKSISGRRLPVQKRTNGSRRKPIFTRGSE